MGFFSWKTSDTHQSIGNDASSFSHKDLHGPVYLLQPDGDPIKEDSYQGYGEFGGIDAYVWIVATNLKDRLRELVKDADPKVLSLVLNDDLTPKPIDKYNAPNDVKADVFQLIDEIRNIGISEYSKRAMFDPNTGKRVINGENGIPFRYDEPIERYGNKSLTELKQDGFFDIKEVAPEFPLKFSFDEHADYHLLMPSPDCPGQGFFYDDSEPASSPS